MRSGGSGRRTGGPLRVRRCGCCLLAGGWTPASGGLRWDGAQLLPLRSGCGVCGRAGARPLPGPYILPPPLPFEPERSHASELWPAFYPCAQEAVAVRELCRKRAPPPRVQPTQSGRALCPAVLGDTKEGSPHKESALHEEIGLHKERGLRTVSVLRPSRHGRGVATHRTSRTFCARGALILASSCGVRPSQRTRPLQRTPYTPPPPPHPPLGKPGAHTHMSAPRELFFYRTAPT